MQKCPVCPKCNGFYTVTQRDNTRYKNSKVPILLNCGHTFCENCILKFSREDKTSITCPQCKIVSIVPEDTPVLKSLQPNFFLIGMLICNQRTLLDQELSRLIPAGASSTLRRTLDKRYGDKLLCQECNINKASCRCVKCDCFYCGLCFTKVHSGYNSLKQHQALELAEGSESPLIKEEFSSVCKDHENRPIEYYCEDDQTPICSRCVIMGAHKGHSITSMEDKNKSVLSEMEPALQTASYVVKKLRKTEQSFPDYSPNFKTETSAVVEEIRTHFSALHGTMQAREQQLIKEVYDKFNDSLLPVLYKKADLHEEKRRLEMSVKAAQRIMNNNNETVLNAREILDHLLRARDIPCVPVKHESDIEETIRFTSGESIDQIILDHGNIEGAVSSRFMLQTVGEIGEIDDTDTISTVSHSSFTETVNSGEDVIVEAETDDTEEDVPKQKVLTMEKQNYRVKYPGHCEQVIVTHIKNPARFYCQKKTDKSKMNSLSKNMNIWCSSLAKPSDCPKHVEEGDLVVAQYSADKMWYRARVKYVIPPPVNTETQQLISFSSSSERESTTQDSETSESITEIITNNKVKTKRKKKDKKHDNVTSAMVLFFDYGNTEIIPLSKMRNMQQRFLKSPSFMLECALHDVEPSNDSGIWCKEAAQTFKKMTDGKIMFMNVIREINGVLQVDLHKPAHNDIMDDSPVSLRESLIFLELACFSYNSEPVSIKPALPSINTSRNYTTPERKSETDTFDVIVTSPETPFRFYVQSLGDESQYLSDMMATMQQTYSVDSGDLYTVYCPQTDMICVAQYTTDGLWYRARVVGLPGRKLVDVQYVDYGYVDRIPYWNLRKILDTFLVLPPQAVYCTLSDIEPKDVSLGWTKEALNWWTGNVLFKKFQLKITGIPVEKFAVVLAPLDENQDPLMSTDNINTQLVRLGYATSTGIWSTGVKQLISNDNDEKPVITDPSSSSNASTTSSTSSRGNDTPKLISPERTPVNSPIPSPKKSLKSVNSLLNKYMTPPKLKQNVAEKLSVNIQKHSQESPSPTKESPHSKCIEVCVSSYVSPSNFYVQLVVKKDKEVKALMEVLQVDCERAELNVEKQWKQGDFCAARFSKDKLWYRAKILNVVNRNLYQTQLVDYGHMDHCSFPDLRSLNNERRKESCFAIKCHLANLYPAGSTDRHKWSQTAREFMENELRGRTCLIQREGSLLSEELGLPIDLIIEDDVPETALEPARKVFYGLSSKIIEAGLAIPMKSSPSKMKEGTKIDNPYYVYNKHPVPKLDTISVAPTFVDYDGIIYAQIVDEDDDLNTLTNSMQSAYMLSDPVVCDWKVGQACVALFEGDECWYRGQIVELAEDKVQVLFVDYGNSSWQTFTSIRQPNQELLDAPLFSLHCYLHNVAPVSENGAWPIVTLEYMHNILVTSQVTIHTEAVSEDNRLLVSVQLPDGSDLTSKLLAMEAVQILDDMTAVYNLSTAITKVLEDTTVKSIQPFSCGFKFPVALTNIEIPNLIYCQHKRLDANQGTDEYRKEAVRINTNLDELESLSIDLNNSAPQSHIWTSVPKPGNVCSAQYSLDSCWYRGLVITVDEDTQLIKVFFMDFGNSEEMPIDRLRVLPKKLQKLPMQAMRCYIADLIPPAGHSTFSFECLRLLPQVLDGKEFLASVKALSPLTIELYLMKIEGEGLQLAHQFLVNEGLAQFAHVSNLFDMAVTDGRTDDTPDVIFEDAEETEEEENLL